MTSGGMGVKWSVILMASKAVRVFMSYSFGSLRASVNGILLLHGEFLSASASIDDEFVCRGVCDRAWVLSGAARSLGLYHMSIFCSTIVSVYT